MKKLKKNNYIEKSKKQNNKPKTEKYIKKNTTVNYTKGGYTLIVLNLDRASAWIMTTARHIFQ